MENNKSFKKFMILWIGELISSMGGGLTAFGLGVYVFQKTQSATNVALVSLLAFLPTILLSAPAGVLADRFDRRLMMILGDSLSAVGVIYILICIMTGNDSLLNICIGVFISSVFSSLLEPAYKATVTDLLTEEEFAKASGMVQMANSSKYLFSPIIAGFLLTVTTIETLLIIDIVTFFVTVSTCLVVKKGIKVKEINRQSSFISDFKEGFNAIFVNKGIVALVGLMSMVSFNMGFIQTLYTPMILSFSNEKILGIVETISALGMLGASLIIGIISIKKNYSKILSSALFCTGVFMVVMGCRENLLIIGVGGFMFFATLPFVTMSADCLVRLNIPNEVQGRAWGLISIFSQFGSVISFAISGVLAEYIFQPLLYKGGILEDSIGKIIGVGKGRGIGLLIIIAGVLMATMGIVIGFSRAIRKLEVDKCTE